MDAIGQNLTPASTLLTKEQSIKILQEVGWVPFSLILVMRPQTASMTTPKPSSPICATVASHVATDDRPIRCPDYQILKSWPGFKTDRWYSSLEVKGARRTPGALVGSGPLGGARGCVRERERAQRWLEGRTPLGGAGMVPLTNCWTVVLYIYTHTHTHIYIYIYIRVYIYSACTS